MSSHLNQYCISSVLKSPYSILRKTRYPPCYSTLFSLFLFLLHSGTLYLLTIHQMVPGSFLTKGEKRCYPPTPPEVRTSLDRLAGLVARALSSCLSSEDLWREREREREREEKKRKRGKENESIILIMRLTRGSPTVN